MRPVAVATKSSRRIHILPSTAALQLKSRQCFLLYLEVPFFGFECSPHSIYLTDWQFAFPLQSFTHSLTLTFHGFYFALFYPAFFGKRKFRVPQSEKVCMNKSLTKRMKGLT